jgi:PAS domain S-box-containing protein
LLFERNLAGIFATRPTRPSSTPMKPSRILGYSREELIGLHRADPFADPAEAGGAWTQLHQQRAVTNYEACLRRKDGEAVWVTWAGSTAVQAHRPWRGPGRDSKDSPENSTLHPFRRLILATPQAVDNARGQPQIILAVNRSRRIPKRSVLIVALNSNAERSEE